MSSINNKLKELGYKPVFEEQTYPESLANLSQKVEYKVPVDYQQFMLENPYTGGFSFIVVLPVNEHIPAARFSKCLPLSLLYGTFSTESGRGLEMLPPYLIIIGIDAGGNCFCLSLDNESHSKVYYLDREEYLYDRDSGQIEGLYLVADCFSDFISNLRIDQAAYNALNDV